MRTAVLLVLISCGSAERSPAPAGVPGGSNTARGSASAPAVAPPETKMSVSDRLHTPPLHVKTLLALRDATEQDVRAALGMRETAVAYEKLKPVDRYGERVVSRAFFFYRGEALVMVYSGDDEYLAQLSRNAIEQELGPPERSVRSRQGKTAEQHLYPTLGFAYSEDGGVVGFIEVFPPMTLAAYLEKIYSDPGEFIR